MSMLSWLDRSGEQLTFYVRALIWIQIGRAHV